MQGVVVFHGVEFMIYEKTPRDGPDLFEGHHLVFQAVKNGDGHMQRLIFIGFVWLQVQSGSQKDESVHPFFMPAA